MTTFLLDRVVQLTTTTGTGAVTLGDVVSGYAGFSGLGDGNDTYFFIEHTTLPEWEVSTGIYSGGVLSRTTVLKSSNSDNPVNFSSGIKNVVLDAPALLVSRLLDGSRGDVVITNSGGTWSVASGVVDVFKIASGLVSGVIYSGQLGSGQVALVHLFSGLVSGYVFSGQIGSGQVASGHLASGLLGNIASGYLSSGFLGSGHLGSGSVQGYFGPTRTVASGTLGVFDFGSGAVVAGAIGSGSVVSGNVGSGQIGGNHVASGSLPATRLNVSPGSAAVPSILTNTPGSGITWREVIDPTFYNISYWDRRDQEWDWVSNEEAAVAGSPLFLYASGPPSVTGIVPVFHGGTGTNAVPASGALLIGTNSGYILSLFVAGIAGSGSITSGVVASGQIGINHLSSGLVSGLILSGQVGSGQVASGHLASGLLTNINSGYLLSGFLGSGHLGSGSVQGFFGSTRHVASGTVGVFDLGSGAVVANTVGSGAVVSGNVASGQIGANHISSGAVGSGRVGSGAVQGQEGSTVNTASGTFDTYDFASGATVTRSLYNGLFLSGTFQTILTGETISGARAVQLTTSGFVRIAMASLSGRMPALGVVVDNVLSGIQVNVYTQGVFQLTSGMGGYSGYNGQLLFVGRSGQIVTSSGAFNSGGLLSGDAVQSVGVVQNSGGIVVSPTIPQPARGRLVSQTRITTGTGTYTKPPGVNSIRVRAVGNGGGGGGAAGAGSQVGAAGGGGAGGYVEAFYPEPDPTYSYSFGAAGTGGSAGANAGTTGGDVTFGSLTAKGGVGGAGAGSGTTAAFRAGGAGGAVSTGGDVNAGGAPGGWGHRNSGTVGASGAGGSGPFGGGGVGNIAGAAGVNATGYGAGGGGALTTAAGDLAGGDGTTGIIIVDEYA